MNQQNQNPARENEKDPNSHGPRQGGKSGSDTDPNKNRGYRVQGQNSGQANTGGDEGDEDQGDEGGEWNVGVGQVRKEGQGNQRSGGDVKQEKKRGGAIPLR